MNGPDDGEMACGEFGPGRMSEPEAILKPLWPSCNRATGWASLRHNRRPTFEPIDPVRGLTNRSSGKQGYAIAKALALRGCDVTLISGPCALKPPPEVHHVAIETAQEMFDEVQDALPCDVFIGVAAVSDWRAAAIAPEKQKKSKDDTWQLHLVKTLTSSHRSVCTKA